MTGLPWFSRDLTKLVHPIMAGRVYGVLASTGTGKTLTDLNTVAHVLDVEPEARVMVAATEETDRYHDLLACRAAGVSYRDWFYHDEERRLEEAEVCEVARWRTRCEQEERLYLLPERRPTLQQIVSAIRERGTPHLLVVDHVHALDDQGERLPEFVGRTMGVLAEMATRLSMAVIAFAQVHRPPGRHDRLYPYRIPALASGMSSSKIEQDSDVVLGLSRKLRDDTPAEALARMAKGLLNRGESERDYEEPGVARVTCLKHRMDDEARNRSVLLTVHRGKMQDRLAVVGGDAWESP